MKLYKIFLILMTIAISNCVTNMNYSADAKRLFYRSIMGKKHYASKSTRNSFMEKNSKIKNNKKFEKNEAEGKAKAKSSTYSKMVTAIERNFRAKKTDSEIEKKARVTTKVLKTAIKLKKYKSTKSKTQLQTKYLPIIFIAILVTAFIAKTIFTYVEKKYKEKLMNVLNAQIEQLSGNVGKMVDNEIQSCTITSLILATNKEIIMLYKLKLVYLKVYMLNFKESECQSIACESFTKISEREKCFNDRERCLSFAEIKDNFAAIHDKVDAGVKINVKMLNIIKSNACNQKQFYDNLQDELRILEAKAEDLQDQLGFSVEETANGAVKTIFNSLLATLWNNDAFTSVSFTRTSDVPVVLNIGNAIRVSRRTFIEDPVSTTSKALDEVKKFKNSFKTKTIGNRELTDKHKKIYEQKYSSMEKSFENLEKVMNNNFPEEDTKKIVELFDQSPEARGLNQEQRQAAEITEASIRDEKLKRHLINLKFAKTVIDYVRKIFAFLALFDIAVAGLSFFAVIEALLEIVVRIMNVAIAHVEFSMIKTEERQNKTKQYKLKRRGLFDAYAQLAFSFVYLTFLPISIILKGTYDAIIKMTDMVDSIKQLKQQELYGGFQVQLGKIKRKHSDLFKTYNICEAKFHGNLNILTIVNTIIKDEIDIIRHENIDSYNKFMNSLISNPHSRKLIKDNIKLLCNENIQFCSHSISEEFLTNYLDFSYDEVTQLKKQAIYGPYSNFGVAKNIEELKSFMNLGYEPIGATDYFRTTNAFGYTKDEEDIIRKMEADNYMLMGCRMCSTKSIIRHIEIFDDIEDRDPFRKYQQRNPDFTGSCDATEINEKICKCIYKDTECLTHKVKSIRLNSRKTLLYEIIRRYPEVPKINRHSDSTLSGTEKPTYPGLDKIFIWTQSMKSVNNYNKILNNVVDLKFNVGIWDTKDKSWKDLTDERSPTPYVSNSVSQNLTNFKYLLLINSKTDYIVPSNSYPVLADIFKYNHNSSNTDLNNSARSMRYNYFYLHHSNHKIYNDKMSTLESFDPLEYNIIFYPSAAVENIVYNSSYFKQDFLNEDDIKKTSLMNGGIIISFPPFKPKTMDFSQFVEKLKKECESVCTDNDSTQKDFNICPSNKISYNYIAKKTIFNEINETRTDSYKILMENESLSPERYPYYKDKSYIGYNLLTHPKSVDLINEDTYTATINENIKANYNIFRININLNKNPSGTLGKYIKFHKNNEDKLSVTYLHELDSDSITTPNIVTLDISQIVNQIFIVISLDELGNNDDYKLFTKNGFTMIKLEDKFMYKNNAKLRIGPLTHYIVYLFIKPLPSSGFIPLKTFGKVKCFTGYLNNFINPGEKKSTFIIPETLYSKDEISAQNEFLLNFYTLTKASAITNAGDIAYHPFDLFKFDDNNSLSDVIFNKVQCVKDNFSFSIPIRFHKHPNNNNNSYYRHISIDDDNKITESYKLAGPDINEIYWLQFTKYAKADQEEINLSDQLGYFQYHSFELDYTLLYLSKKSTYGNKWNTLAPPKKR